MRSRIIAILFSVMLVSSFVIAVNAAEGDEIPAVSEEAAEIETETPSDETEISKPAPVKGKAKKHAKRGMCSEKLPKLEDHKAECETPAECEICIAAAEREAKKAEREAEREAKKAEREAEREAKKAEREAKKAELEAHKAECETPEECEICRAKPKCESKKGGKPAHGSKHGRK